jgi:hypothetical protein
MPDIAAAPNRVAWAKRRRPQADSNPRIRRSGQTGSAYHWKGVPSLAARTATAFLAGTDPTDGKADPSPLDVLATSENIVTIDSESSRQAPQRVYSAWSPSAAQLNRSKQPLMLETAADASSS